MPTPEELFAIIVFSLIGLGAFRFGKIHQRWQQMVIGITLMLFPYFIPAGFWLYAVGAALVAALFVFRER